MTPPAAPFFDVAIVLGAAVAADGRPGPALRRRVSHAVELAASGRVGMVLMSGGPVRHPVPEAHLMRDLALAAGLSAERIFVEAESRDTIGNARLCRPIVQCQGWQRVLVVTDSHHLPRALFVFRRVGLAVSGAAAGRGGGFGPDWWLRWGRECLALPWAAIRLWRERPEIDAGGSA